MDDDLRSILISAYEADLLALEACEVDDPVEIRQRAVAALKHNPLSVNAWCLIASQAPAGSEQQLDLFHRAMTIAMSLAGMGPNGEGPSPDDPAARPLAKALAGLASAQRASGNLDHAIDTYFEVLRFDPTDGFRIRYDLAHCLLTTRRVRRLSKLLRRFEADRSAIWCWTRALIEFRMESDDANDWLDNAVDSNPYIGPYLLNRLNWDGEAPVHCQPAEETEAAWYSSRFAQHWNDGPDAKSWLAHRTGLN